MNIQDLIEKQQSLGFNLEKTNFKFGRKYEGKVRDNYILNGKRIIITTDRISAFDRILCTIPFKGQVLTKLSVFWFEKTKKIAKNHLIANPDPNVMVVKECRVLPIEMVVRGFLSGSAWRDYKSGKPISGIYLKSNLRMNQKLEKPIITPSTKAKIGDHDEHISREEIISKNIIDKKLFERMEDISLRLFNFASQYVDKQGLILVDTKYEFGLSDEDEIFLVDEIHTSDSSRFWYKDSYEKLFENGEDQRMLDKEYLRIWLISKGFMGDGEPPKIPKELVFEISKKYIKAYEEITGQNFIPMIGNISDRIKRNLDTYIQTLQIKNLIP